MCVSCGCGKKKGQPGYGKGPSKSADKKQDAKVMKSMTPAQMIDFKKKDKKMDKNKSMTRKEDERNDKALARKIKAKKK